MPDLAELRALLKRATPLPWLADPSDCEGIKDASGRTSDASDIGWITREKENWGDEWDGDPAANHALVLAAVNALPALLDVAELAEEAVGWMDDLLRTDEIGGDGPYCCREELTAALKRLEEER